MPPIRKNSSQSFAAARRSTDDRLRALADCLARPNENVAALVRQICNDTDPRISRAAILALATCDIDPEFLLAGYSNLRPQQKQALIEVAASKTQLCEAIPGSTGVRQYSRFRHPG